MLRCSSVVLIMLSNFGSKPGTHCTKQKLGRLQQFSTAYNLLESPKPFKGLAKDSSLLSTFLLQEGK